jgi:replicative DNA helicase
MRSLQATWMVPDTLEVLHVYLRMVISCEVVFSHWLLPARRKVLAKELNVPVLALSQLSREVEKRSDKVPMLSDLRDSVAIEQDADVVLFLYRGDLNRQDGQPPADPATRLILAKQRNGPLGEVRPRFENAYATFVPLADSHDHLMAP